MINKNKLSETSFDTYSHSKMFKLLNVIKFNMQDALRYLVENSCKQYHEMIKETCGVCVPLTSAFEWGKGPFSCQFHQRISNFA